MNHQLKQTLCFSLKAHRLCGVGRHNRVPWCASEGDVGLNRLFSRH